MNAEVFQRAEAVFHEAMSLPANRRQYFIDQAVGGQGDLAQRVHRMIRYSERTCATSGLMMEHPADSGGEPCDEDNNRLLGQTIGHYRIINLLGEGGFGAVYQAQQERPVQRAVAMKILNSGMDSRRVIARFEAERQALALMEHPNIARVFDAGQTGPEFGSRPFVVMELVGGEPITSYCDRRRLDCKARLDLFVTVCKAVQHAHQKGIIHRDLKPSNILVGEIDGAAAPKVIDFGIAKALGGGQAPVAQSLMTQRMELLGTPQYMSPEQADSDEHAIDTRSDIYSLGVVLFELLTGTTPLDGQTLRSASYTKMRAMIIEQTPERPSTRLMSCDESAKRAARNLNTDVRSLQRKLRGDLDWITLKALDPDRDRRYGSPLALAEDLRRHMNHQPVEAGPPSTSYRVKKFVRRHRLAVAAAATVALAVIGGAIGTTLAMLKARDSADQAMQVNQFMKDVLTSVDPESRGADVKLAEVLRSASAAVAPRFAGHPELEAQVRSMLAGIYNRLSMWGDSSNENQKVQAIWLSIAGRDDPRTMQAQLEYSRALGNQNRPREAKAVLAEVGPRIEHDLGPDHVLSFEAQRQVGITESFMGRIDEGTNILRLVLRKAQRAKADERTLLAIMDSLVYSLDRQARGARGERLQEINNELVQLSGEYVERIQRESGPDALMAIRARVSQARALCRRGDFDVAADTCRNILNTSTKRLGECHEIIINAKGLLALTEYRLGRPVEAADLILQEIECKRTSGSPIVLLGVMYEAMPYLDQGGRWAEGEALTRELSAALKEYGGGHGAMLFGADLYTARFVARQGRIDEADQMFAALLARRQEADAESLVAARLEMFYGGLLAQHHQFEQAQQHLQQAVKTLGNQQPGTWDTVSDDLMAEFVILYQAWVKPEKLQEYQSLREKALRGMTSPD